MKFDLEKDTAKVRWMLEKRNLPKLVTEVICVLDVSGSTKAMYEDGEMQEAVQRVVPVALNFDDNGELPTYTFCGVSYKIPTPITAANYATFVKRQILDMGIPKWGGTSYEPVLKDVLMDLGFYGQPAAEPTRGGGFFSKLLGKVSQEVASTRTSIIQRHSQSKLPAIIYIFTDGENDDRGTTTQLLQACANNGVEAYFNFIGIGHTKFSYLEKTADLLPNVGFAQIHDIVATGGSDDIYDYLLPNELTDWLKAFVKTTA